MTTGRHPSGDERRLSLDWQAPAIPGTDFVGRDKIFRCAVKSLQGGIYFDFPANRGLQFDFAKILFKKRGLWKKRFYGY